MSDPATPLKPNLSLLDGIALQDDEPVFAEPWEAQAFAMAVQLHQSGLFSWQEWADQLSAEIHSGEERSYYQHWLAALEKLIARKTDLSAHDFEDRTQAWHDAAARTPHGQTIKLERENR